MFACTTAFNLHKIRMARKYRTHEGDIENIRAIINCGHHADRDAYPRFAARIAFQEVGRTHQIIIGKVDGDCWASAINEVTCTAKSDWYCQGSVDLPIG